MFQRLALAGLVAVVPGAALAQTTPARDNIDSLIEVQARAHKVPAAFVHRVVKRESNYNPRAKGGSALGLMQIKHATARGLGYSGDAAGLYDPETNLKYGIAYLAGAYRAAKGDLDQAYRYYNRGYYYAAKQLGITTEVPADEPAPAPAATTATGFAGLFGLRGGAAAPVQTASADPSTALAYAPGTAAAAAVEVPLPPQRPAALGSVAAAPEPAAPAQTAVATAQPAAQPAQAAPQAAPVAANDLVEVPLPPRRPAATLLAAVKRPTPTHETDTPEPIYQAAAVAPAQ